MRIIAGKKRGMTLLIPKTDVTRPYTDRVKESLFSVLYKYNLIEGRAVADVFSGVGSMGLEALSRGASYVAFVESDRKILDCLRKNIERGGFEDVSTVFTTNAFRTGAPIGPGREPYSLIFVDPPYALSKDAGPGSMLAKMMAILPNQLADDGLVILRVEGRTAVEEEYGQLEQADCREWGRMRVILYKKKSENDVEQKSGD